MNKQEYLEVASRRKGTDSAAFDLDMPSGAVWRVLPVSLEPYILMGRLPMHLIASLRSLKDVEKDAGSIMEQLSGNDVINMYAIVRDVMLANIIEPKISMEPGDNTLTPDEIIPEDFEFFRTFVLSGGQVRLDSFRKSFNRPDNQPDRETAADGAADAGPDGAASKSAAVSNS